MLIVRTTLWECIRTWLLNAALASYSPGLHLCIMTIKVIVHHERLLFTNFELYLK